MSPIQQMLLGVGAVATKTYVDDVFSIQAYRGTGQEFNVVNGIDLAGEGGMVWAKARDKSYDHCIMDSARDGKLSGNKNEYLVPNSNAAEGQYENFFPHFNNNGYTVGADGNWLVNRAYHSNPSIQYTHYVNWCFRRAKGFFDVVTFSPSSYSSNQRISHSLGCIPGLILLKSTTESENWYVYHRSLGEDKYLSLNGNGSATTSTSAWGPDGPTATDFGFNTNGLSSAMPITYVAYLFAGGESEAATARSVDFDGNGDYLSFTGIPIGTNDFTMEAWIYPTGGLNYPCILDTRNNDHDDDGFFWGLNSSNRLYLYTDSGDRVGGTVNVNQWSHVALVRDYSAATTTMYINGSSVGSWTSDNVNYSNNLTKVGWSNVTGNTHHYWDGKLSNVRITIGQTLYTSSFRPPTEPLTTTSQGATASNVKLLCCNGSSTTSATVGTITSNGDPTASTDSPFDDPAGFVFGENEDQGIIKCGSYVGNNAEDGPEVFLGFEPSFLLIKSVDTSDPWVMFDNLRGMTVDGISEPALLPNTNDAEASGGYLAPISTGFKLTTTSDRVNNDSTYMYIAIRRRDGYVGKPRTATELFAMAAGTSNSDIPTFVSGFPVDFSLYRNPTATSNWSVNSRLLGTERVYANSNAAESTNSDITWDFQNGFYKDTGDVSDYQAWMWKRHAGMDVVTWSGTNSSVVRRHNLGKTPEMIWFKSRSSTRNWRVYHIGLNGGTNPEDYAINLNQDDPESSNTNYMTSTAPTATHFVSGNDDDTNGSGKTYIAMLFASVEGISKVGSYDGTGSAQTITTGFQPRFAIIRRTDGTEDHWLVLDTTRGWGSGDDKGLKLNATSAQGTTEDYGAPTSTGFSLTSNGWVNYNTGNYIYYAHA